MRLLFFRHGDPDYVEDGLTEKGKAEAALLAKYIKEFGLDDIYVSPLGRAKLTADYSLKALGRDAVVLDWLKEFPAEFDPEIADEKTRMAYANELKKDPETGRYKKRIVWDILPSYYSDHPELFDAGKWQDSDIAAASDMREVHRHVTDSFDELLSGYGYIRNKTVYNVKENNDKRIGFFCHFGVTSVILAHLWNISPFVTMQFLAMAPTSVTEVVTEEREKGTAIFRTLRIGDITHLNMAGEEPSFSARFCERFENEHERH